MYINLLYKTIRSLFKNLGLFIPDLLLLVVTFIIGFILLNFSGLLDFIVINRQAENLLALFTDFLAGNVGKLILSVIIFLVTTFFFGASFKAIKFNMMATIVKNKKYKLKEILKPRFPLIKNVILLKILIYVINILALIAILILYSVLSVINNVIAVTIAGLFAILLFLIINLALFFKFQAMFMENKTPLDSIKRVITYFGKNKKHVVMTVLMVFVIILFSLPLSSLLDFFFQFFDVFSGVFYKSFIAVLVFLLTLLVNITVGLLTELYMFYSYNSKT